ncbi:GBE1 (predicted) [Pycnogonum litorale]
MGNNIDPMKVDVPCIERLFGIDPYLKPFEREIRRRHGVYKQYLEAMDENEGGIIKFAEGYKLFGLNVRDDNSIVCREWAPAADGVFLRGDFNDWNRVSHSYKKLDHGKWELIIPPKKDGSCAIEHDSRIKVVILTKDGQMVDRLSPWATYVVRSKENILYEQHFYNPPKHQRYVFKHPKPKPAKNLKIYEAHVGISSSEPVVASYSHFAHHVIPRIAEQGYNAVELMAIMEHVYYASFGYQVTSFFAPSR